MQYSDTTNKNGILQDLENRCNLGDTGLTAVANATKKAQFTTWINQWYVKATELIITADGRWRWDDTNQTNQPTATTDLVDSQEDYEVMSAAPSTGQDWLEVERVEIQTASASTSTWRKLLPLNLAEVGTSIKERFKTDSRPIFFDFDGVSIHLYPNPNYSATDGLKLWFSRAPLVFTVSDTTKRPGFASLFHEYLVLGPTYNWQKYRQVGNPQETFKDIESMEKQMKQFYSRRNQYEPPLLTRKYQSYI